MHELGALIETYLAEIDEKREGARRDATVQDALRLAGEPSSSARDEAFAGALLLDQAPPAATEWLDERFGLTSADLKDLL